MSKDIPPAGTPVDQKLYNEACRHVMDLEAERNEWFSKWEAVSTEKVNLEAQVDRFTHGAHSRDKRIADLEASLEFDKGLIAQYEKEIAFVMMVLGAADEQIVWLKRELAEYVRRE